MTSRSGTPVTALLADLNRVLAAVTPDPPDSATAVQERNSFVREESVRTLDAHAQLLLHSAGENLEALDRLVIAGDLAIAPWVIARASLEASAHVVWILERKVSVKQRVGRSLALRYESLRAQERLASSEKNVRLLTRIRDRIDEVEKVAQELGFQRLRDHRGRINGIAVRKPSNTDLVTEVLCSANIYRILSGVAHSDTVTLSQLAFAPAGSADRHGLIKVATPARSVLKLLVPNVAAAYSRAVWEAILRYGADAADAAVVLEKRFDELDLRDDNRTRFWRTKLTVGDREHG